MIEIHKRGERGGADIYIIWHGGGGGDIRIFRLKGSIELTGPSGATAVKGTGNKGRSSLGPDMYKDPKIDTCYLHTHRRTLSIHHALLVESKYI